MSIFQLRKLTTSEKDFVRDCIGMLCGIVRLYGFESDGYSPKKTIDHWIYCCSMSDEHPIAFVKHKMATFYGYAKRNENYDEYEKNIWELVDKPGVILGGRAMRFMQKLERCDPKAFESLCLTMLFAKRGMPRPGKELLKQAEKKAFIKLTTPSPVQKPLVLRKWGDENVCNITGLIDRDRVKSELRRRVHEIYAGKVYSDLDRLEVFTPTTSANYINSRKNGGVIGQLLDEHSDLLVGLATKDELIQLKWVNVGKASHVLDYKGDNLILYKSTEQSLQVVDFSRLDARFSELYLRICKKALKSERPLAKPLALAEALKTRVISKGPGLLYTALKPLQKFMWDVLSKHPTFRLTGTPVTSDILQDIIGAKLKDFERFLSVDYSDATNEIESWTSECTMNAIADEINLSDFEREMSLRSLTGHILEYKNEEKEQMRGQLMGGILSFPILCIINATVLAMTKEIVDDRKYTLKDACIAVNGDDGVLKTTLYGRDVWKAIGSFCGLKPSIGKCYFSKTFLNINSTTYNYHSEGWEGFRSLRKDGRYAIRVCYYELVKYVNMGLLHCMKRSGGAVSSVDIDRDNLTFGARCKMLIESAPSSMHERIMGQFLHLNKDRIKIDLPYFIPENMGGLGLPAVGKYTSSDADLRYARLIHENPHKYKMPAFPTATAWKFWEYATKRFPFKSMYANTGFEGGKDMVSLTTIRSKACVEAIFRAKNIEDLLLDIAKPDAVKIYQQNCRRIWTRARRITNPPEPYVQGKFPQQYNNNDRPLFHVLTVKVKYDDNVFHYTA